MKNHKITHNSTYPVFLAKTVSMQVFTGKFSESYLEVEITNENTKETYTTQFNQIFGKSNVRARKMIQQVKNKTIIHNSTYDFFFFKQN